MSGRGIPPDVANGPQCQFEVEVGGSSAKRGKSQRLMSCMPGCPNNQAGLDLPEHVCVRLDFLGCDLEQWRGLEYFICDVQQSFWERGKQFYGVEFHRSVE